MRVAVVVSRFNGEVTSRMLEVALEKAKRMNLEVPFVCRVPGAYDMPVVVEALLRKEAVDAVATLGAIVKGQTKHDEVIAQATAISLQRLAVKYGKAVSMGITGPGMSERQAYARIRPVAERAIEAAAAVHGELERIR